MERPGHTKYAKNGLLSLLAEAARLRQCGRSSRHRPHLATAGSWQRCPALREGREAGPPRSRGICRPQAGPYTRVWRAGRKEEEARADPDQTASERWGRRRFGGLLPPPPPRSEPDFSFSRVAWCERRWGAAESGLSLAAARAWGPEGWGSGGGGAAAQLGSHSMGKAGEEGAFTPITPMEWPFLPGLWGGGRPRSLPRFLLGAENKRLARRFVPPQLSVRTGGGVGGGQEPLPALRKNLRLVSPLPPPVGHSWLLSLFSPEPDPNRMGESSFFCGSPLLRHQRLQLVLGR